jgi:hypothetical protein
MNADPINRVALPWNGQGIGSAPGQRSRARLEEVIAQFKVDTHGRYAVRDTSGDGIADTFCNIFLWDWSIAMGAELPHWVDDKGKPTQPNAAGSHELSANGLIGWLKAHGSRYGWISSSEGAARLNALTGSPSVVVWQNPSGRSGHVAVVRPAPSEGEARIAQAGSHNFSDGLLSRGFGKVAPLLWWIHV